VIETRRLRLVPATIAHLHAELAGHQALTAVIGAEVPSGWPPDLYDADAIRFLLDAAGNDTGSGPWGLYYLIRRAQGNGGETVVGVAGFKGPPDAAGIVELGYGVVEEHQRQGYATEAVQGLVRFAFASSNVATVVAQTLPHLAPSIGVLLKAGFTFAGPGNDPHAPPGEEVVRYEIRRGEAAASPHA
jgi:RimJ/RimL family protein N-acetyltransferase